MFTLNDLAIPIIAAPMAGGASTPNLAVAVSDAGGLGFLAGGYKTPTVLAEQIVDVQQRTNNPFGVNLFVPQLPLIDRAAVEAYRDALARENPSAVFAEIDETDDDWFSEKVAVVIARQVPVVSFTFGLPPVDAVERMHTAGSFLIATVTSVPEARQAVDRGVDALCVQGPEAGGHRGTFTTRDEPGTLALGELLIAIREVVTLPLIVAGGIHSGGQIASLLAAGAEAVQLGTALLRTDESGAQQAHQDALVDPRFTETVITWAFSGRPARGLRNGFITAHDATVPHEYPQVHHLTKTVRADAARRGDPHGLALWAGTGFREAGTGSAATVLGALWADTHAAVVS
ncbi:nitronate monooxygenase [Cryobacterium levicorallinum]|uniref:Propionate 3-nitronate monooxygenase n=1 Tax=Cryobacterium levicorallinum TaxID=995038 RepID=A0A1I3A4Z1_9MICO|nr:nitronate monooxygenase [Cryobacterium levicorallinum]TFB82648.1 nitronate monooxygenase [Cryobacterium levicorallinum]GEP26322.1 oxidoreductase [Cryobacterium levicorallinum]SFH45193.1 nitronate monooxygenase [Cryobacterium levicorallinum]